MTTMPTFLSSFITTLWTPIFVAIFLAVLVYALWPSNREAFDAAAKMPLRED
jgi:cytochrome c oxidase cbb3-type subunit 4